MVVRPSTKSAARPSGLLAAQDTFAQATSRLRFAPPVAHIYHPLLYAREIAAAYLTRYGQGRKKLLLLGMNPGPFGMGQTGIPFGEVATVKGWLGLDGRVERPRHEHEKRPVLGLSCTRSEVSGKRLWGAIGAKYPCADAFFADAFVLNYCPLLFLDAAGRNLTPDKLPAQERAPLERLCDAFLVTAVDCLHPSVVIGVGGYAAHAASRALGDRVRVVTISHPSPASPKANRGWTELVRGELVAAGIEPFL